MPRINGITDISAEWKNDRLVSTGKGYDDSGEFLERFEYYDITDGSYSFKMDRSYDGGGPGSKVFPESRHSGLNSGNSGWFFQE